MGLPVRRVRVVLEQPEEEPDLHATEHHLQHQAAVQQGVLVDQHPEGGVDQQDRREK